MTKTNDEKLCDKKTESECLVPIQYYSLEQADRGFARSRLCTDGDGTTNNLVLYMVRNDTSKKGGDKEKERGVCNSRYFNPPQASLK